MLMTKKQFLQTLFLFEIFFSSTTKGTSSTGLLTYRANSQNVTLLNPLQMVSQLKQLVRLCFYLRRIKRVNLQFLVDNPAVLRLLTILYTTYPLLVPHTIDTLLHRKSRHQLAVGLLVQFGSQYFNQVSAVRRLFTQHIFLSQHFLLGSSLIKLDAYKMHVDYTDFKKVLFIGLLLGQCFEKK